VLGTGTMASGIAEVCAKAGYEVVVRGSSSRRRTRRSPRSARASARRWSAASSRSRHATRSWRATPRPRTSPTSRTATSSSKPWRRTSTSSSALFAELDEVCKPDALLATTTSSLPVIECAMATSRPERVVGIHFFNPARDHAPRGDRDTRYAPTTDRCSRRPGPSPRPSASTECCAGDRAGFIVNALLFPYLNDAVRMLEEGYATVTDIDTAMKLGAAIRWDRSSSWTSSVST
jgi:3-hydroxybutyryl-CoA dehydrogenase